MTKAEIIENVKDLTNAPSCYGPLKTLAEEWLEAQGWKPINPAKFNAVFGDNPTGRLLDAVCETERAAIPLLDAIYLLKGWPKSKGAKRELEVALKHNLIVLVEGESDAS